MEKPTASKRTALFFEKAKHVKTPEQRAKLGDDLADAIIDALERERASQGLPPLED